MLVWICGALLILLLGGWVVLNQKCGGRYRHFSRISMEGLRLRKLTPPFLYILETTRVSTRAPILFFRIQRSVQKIYGLRHSAEMSLIFMADCLAYSWLVLTGGCLWSMSTGDPVGIWGGGLLSVLLPASMVKDLSKKALIRDQDMVMELPEMLNKMILLVGAGENVQKAIVHCVERKSEDKHPLYVELRKMIGDWESGHSFQQAFEQFSKRCAIQEVSIFTTTVLLNFRRGGNDFVVALRDLSRVLWEKRKAIARTRGEQASSKLIFPMVVIFMIVIVLVGAPALMMMNM